MRQDCCQLAASLGFTRRPRLNKQETATSPCSAGLGTKGRASLARPSRGEDGGAKGRRDRGRGAPRDARTCSTGCARRLPAPGKQRGRAAAVGSETQARSRRTQGPSRLRGAGQQPGQAAQAFHGVKATGKPRQDAGPACRNSSRSAFCNNRTPRLREPSHACALLSTHAPAWTACACASGDCDLNWPGNASVKVDQSSSAPKVSIISRSCELLLLS